MLGSRKRQAHGSQHIDVSAPARSAISMVPCPANPELASARQQHVTVRRVPSASPEGTYHPPSLRCRSAEIRLESRNSQIGTPQKRVGTSRVESGFRIAAHIGTSRRKDARDSVDSPVLLVCSANFQKGQIIFQNDLDTRIPNSYRCGASTRRLLSQSQTTTESP